MQHTQIQGGQLSGFRHYFNPVLNEYKHQKQKNRIRSIKRKQKWGHKKRQTQVHSMLSLTLFK